MLWEHRLGGYSGGLGDGDDDDLKYGCEIPTEERKREGGSYIALHHQCATRTGDEMLYIYHVSLLRVTKS